MIEYGNFNYYPKLTSKPAEIKGLLHLPDLVKNKILPTFVLGKWMSSQDVVKPYEAFIKAFGNNRNFILDITDKTDRQSDGSKELDNPEGDFKAWRAYVESLESSVIPAVQASPQATLRNVVRQAIKLESFFGALAFNIDIFDSSTIDKQLAALSALDEPSNSIIQLDYGYITQSSFTGIRSRVIEVINDVRRIDPTLEIVVTGSSFPRSAAEYGDSQGAIPILERELFLQIGGDNVAIYGDHASIHPKAPTPGIMRFVPRVDYATPDNWIYRRRKAEGDNKSAYIECAKSIIESEEWDDGLNVWGANEIRRVANGDTDKMLSPQNWIAVRVNLHIYQQTLSTASLSEYDDDFEYEAMDEWDELF